MYHVQRRSEFGLREWETILSARTKREAKHLLKEHVKACGLNPAYVRKSYRIVQEGK